MRIHSISLNLPQWYLVPLASFSHVDIQQKSAALTRYLQLHPQATVDEVTSILGEAEICGTHRKAIIANSTLDLTQQLTAEHTNGKQSLEVSQVVFMFPGIGDHYVQMGRNLYSVIPYFREILDTCAAELESYLQDSLINLLYPEGKTPTETEAKPTGLDLAAMLGRKSASTVENITQKRLQETAVAHPLVFSIEYALAKLLQHWGVQPQALIGYSLGEYVAATISGVLTLTDALALVAQRAKLIQDLPTGKMLAVPLSKEEITPYLNQEVSLSAHNGDALTILAGDTDAIINTQQHLQKQQIASRLLDTTHAFHSHMMQDAVKELTHLAETLNYASPKIPYLSNVTGTWITAQQAMDPAYWAKHMCQPVQCYSMLQQLLGQPSSYQLIEVGPGQSLGSFSKQHPQCKQEQYSLIHPTLRYSYDQQDDHWFLLSTMRKLWLSGVDLHWKTILPETPNELNANHEIPSLFEQPSINNPQGVTLTKNRGEKRREKQRRRRGNRGKQISS